MAVGAVAGDNSTASPALGVLSTVASAELPAKASELVAQAEAKNLKQTTIDVVKAAVGLNPAAAPAIVGSIAHATHPMAATASATAVALVPNQVLAIARAAAAACPTNAGAIVEAICRVLPGDYREVAETVAGVVPGAGKEILAGIAAAVPQLKPVIEQTVASYQGGIPSVSSVLMHVAQNPVVTTEVASGSSGISSLVSSAQKSSANASPRDLVIPPAPPGGGGGTPGGLPTAPPTGGSSPSLGLPTAPPGNGGSPGGGSPVGYSSP